MSITLTETAIAEISKVMAEHKFATTEYALRVGVAGGCSGVQYQFGFEKKEDGDPLNDATYTFGELETRVNRFADNKINGTIIDFYEGVDKRGFVFNNPNEKAGCGGGGCGSGGCGH